MEHRAQPLERARARCGAYRLTLTLALTLTLTLALTLTLTLTLTPTLTLVLTLTLTLPQPGAPPAVTLEELLLFARELHVDEQLLTRITNYLEEKEQHSAVLPEPEPSP